MSGMEVDICCGWWAQPSGPGSGAAVSTLSSSDTGILVSKFFSLSVNALGPANTQEKEANGLACYSQLPGHKDSRLASIVLSRPGLGVGNPLSGQFDDLLEAIRRQALAAALGAFSSLAHRALLMPPGRMSTAACLQLEQKKTTHTEKQQGCPGRQPTVIRHHTQCRAVTLW